MNYDMIILAAGKGTRMKSELPKVLQPVGGKAMLLHLIDRAKALCCKKPIIICGHRKELLKQSISEQINQPIHWVEQKEQLGTGHAVAQTLSYLNNETIYFILVGDIPLIKEKTLISLGKAAHLTGIAILTVIQENPLGYGRIIRDQQKIVNIIEEKEANEQERLIKEVNTGIFAVTGQLLKELVVNIKNNNSQKEYYLTDIINIAASKQIDVQSVTISDPSEVIGCNDKKQLAEIERLYQKNKANQLLEAGVTLADPNRIDIRGNLQVKSDSFIDINNIFEGDVTVGKSTHIEANCIIKNSQIGDFVKIKANSYIENAIIDHAAEVGPFARVRPGSHLKEKSKVGNFVETKNTTLEKGSKASHLSYLGDSQIGQNVNIGAGTITCNYDGVNKYQTIIEDDCFIGSNSSLIAPLHIQRSSTIAAGSVIHKNVSENTLSFGRAKQVDKKDWKRPNKK